MNYYQVIRGLVIEFITFLKKRFAFILINGLMGKYSFDTPIEELNIKPYTEKVLKLAGINTVGDAVYTLTKGIKVKGVGAATVEDFLNNFK